MAADHGGSGLLSAERRRSDECAVALPQKILWLHDADGRGGR